MAAGDHQVLDVVLFAGRHPDDAAAAAVLRSICRERHALHVVAARQRDDDVLVGDELLCRQLPRGVVHDLGAPVVTIFGGKLVEVGFDEEEDLSRVGEDRLELRDELDGVAILVVELLPFEARQPSQLHLEDRLGLRLGEAELLAHPGDEHQLLTLVRADHLDDLVDVIVRDLEALEDVRSVLRVLEIVLAPPSDDVAAVVDVVLEDLLEREGPRLRVDEREHVEVERRLHGGVLVQVVEHERRVVVALHLDDDAHALAVALVPDIRDAGEALVLHELGDLLDERGLVHRVRELGDDDRIAVPAQLLVVGFGPGDHAPATLRVGSADRVHTLDRAGLYVPLLVEAIDRAAAGEVRAGHCVAEVVGGELGVVDQAFRGLDDLAQVVRRDVGRHADGDAGRAVDQQVRQTRRQDGRLLMPVVVVRHPGHGLVLDVRQHLVRDRGQASLGVARRARRIVVDRVMGEHAGREGEVLRRVDREVVHVGAAGRLDLGDALGEARRDREGPGPMETFGDRGPRERHELVFCLELLGLAVRAVAEHEAVIGGADDLRSGLEGDLHDRVVAPDETRSAQRLDAHIAVRVDGEDLSAQPPVGHLDELGERLLLAAIELDLHVAAEAAEVPLSLHERVASSEVLRHAHQRVVDRRVAVRVVLPHHLAVDRGALAEAAVAPQAHLVHREEDSPLHGLEPVAHVGQRARDDDAHRVVEVRLAHLVLELGVDHAVVPRLLDHVRRRSPSFSACSRSTAARTRANASSVAE